MEQSKIVKLHLAPTFEESVDIEDYLIPYFRLFNLFVEDYGNVERLQEEILFSLEQRLWALIIDLYREHYLNTPNLPYVSPITLTSTNDKLKDLDVLSFSNLYAIVRALDFYDAPLLRRCLVVVIVRHLLPLTLYQLYLTHPDVKKFDEEAVIRFWNSPVQWINREYNKKEVVVDAIFEHYNLRGGILEELSRLRPRTETVLWCGTQFSFVLTSNGLYGCGQNIYDQLGQDSGASYYEWATIPVETVITVACGDYHSLILTTEGLFGTGLNDVGQLGTLKAKKQPSTRPRRVALDPQLVVKMMACGSSFSLILTNEGLYACGNNALGQLGLGDEVQRVAPTKVEALNQREVVQVVAGSRHSLALTKEGVVFGWGYNVYGELGLGDKQKRLLPTEIPALSHTTIKMLACGASHSLALSSDGELYVCGNGEYSQLGSAHLLHQLTWIKVNLSEELRPSVIFASRFQSMFITEKNDSLYAFGLNSEGQLGLKVCAMIHNPTRVPLSSPVITVAMGFQHTLILCKDGLYGCGNNNEGQLGLGSTVATSELTKLTLVIDESLNL